MARNTFSGFPDTTVAANLQNWASKIPAILTAGGMVQTADTGQANFSTIAATTAVNQSRGYQIWRSNDAAGGLNNWYLKIEVGSGVVNGIPALWITVGWGSDGAGNLTGNMYPRTQIAQSSGGSTTVSTVSYFWADTEAMCLGLFGANLTYSTFLVIERVRDNTGAKKDEVFIWAAVGSSTTGISADLPRSGTIPTNTLVRTNGMRNLPAGVVSYNADFGFSDIAPIKGIAQMPSGNIFGADDTNFSTVGAQNTMTAYGETRTFVTLASGTWTSGYKIMMRYDL